MAGAENELSIQTEPRNTRSEHYVEIYSNSFALRISAFDISVVFQRLVESAVGEVTRDQQATVTLTPAGCKLLLQSLRDAINAYEQTFGQINLTPGMGTSVDYSALADILGKTMQPSKKA